MFAYICRVTLLSPCKYKQLRQLTIRPSVKRNWLMNWKISADSNPNKWIVKQATERGAGLPRRPSCLPHSALERSNTHIHTHICPELLQSRGVKTKARDSNSNISMCLFSIVYFSGFFSSFCVKHFRTNIWSKCFIHKFDLTQFDSSRLSRSAQLVIQWLTQGLLRDGRVLFGHLSRPARWSSGHKRAF